MRVVPVLMAVPHSGNHTVVKFLEEALGLTWERDYTGDEIKGDFIQHHPLETGEWGRFILANISPEAIVPIRHPYKTAVSNFSKWNRPPVQIGQFWRGLIYRSEIHNCHYLPIDIEHNREKTLFEIAQLFGKEHLKDEIVKFSKEWPVCNKDPSLNRPELTKNEKQQLQFAVDFYEEVIKNYTS